MNALIAVGENKYVDNALHWCWLHVWLCSCVAGNVESLDEENHRRRRPHRRPACSYSVRIRMPPSIAIVTPT